MRDRRGKLALRTLAAQLGVSASTVSMIERGFSLPTPETTAALAEWLGWTVEAVELAARTSIDEADAQNWK